MPRTGPRPKRWTGKFAECPICKGLFWQPRTRPNKTCSIACRDKNNERKLYRPEVQEKLCTCCHEWKPWAEFPKQRGVRIGKYGLQSYCRPCGLEKNRLWREVHRPLRPKPRKTPEALLERKLMHNKRRMHAKRAGGPMPSIEHLEAMCCDQDWRCVYCGNSLADRHLDHKHPIIKGGDNDISNLQWLCPSCNLKKSTLTDDEFIGRVGCFGHQSAKPFPDGLDMEAVNEAISLKNYRKALDLLKPYTRHA